MQKKKKITFPAEPKAVSDGLVHCVHMVRHWRLGFDGVIDLSLFKDMYKVGFEFCDMYCKWNKTPTEYCHGGDFTIENFHCFILLGSFIKLNLKSYIYPFQ